MHYSATGAKLDQKGNERSEARSLFCALTLHCITLKPGFHDRQPSARWRLFMLTIHALSVNVLLARLPTLSLTIGGGGGQKPGKVCMRRTLVIQPQHVF